MIHQIIPTRIGELHLGQFPEIEIPKGKLKNKVQREMVQVLLDKVFGEQVTIGYFDSGAPYLLEKPSWQISISHSSNRIVVYLSEQTAVGVDLQEIREGIYEGRSYFINETEEVNFAEELQDAKTLLSIWCVKEAAYKLVKGISNAKHALVVSKGEGEDWVCRIANQDYRFKLQQLDHFLLVYNDLQAIES